LEWRVKLNVDTSILEEHAASILNSDDIQTKEGFWINLELLVSRSV
jgi:hypothetical protein